MSLEAIDDPRSLSSVMLNKNILSCGATLVGFGDVSCGLAAELSHLPTAISLAIIQPLQSDQVNLAGGKSIYNHQCQEINQALEDIERDLVKMLRLAGWRALAIPPDSNQISSSFIAKLYPLFPHKTAATCAGLGWIGKNGLLVNPQYGTRLSWATVLTDAPLVVNPEPSLFSRCGKCRRCVDACPAGALSGADWSRENAGQPLLDADACRRQLEKNLRDHGAFACGRCVLACFRGPKNASHQFDKMNKRKLR